MVPILLNIMLVKYTMENTKKCRELKNLFL